jgi:hypothetical protein
MRSGLMLVIALILTGCATAYQPDGYGGGFSETQLDKNLFKVTFRGNGWTKPEVTDDFALLRGAELTLNNGFTHFAIIDSQLRDERRSYTTPTQSYTTANANAYGNSVYGTAQTTTYGGQTIHSSRPTKTIVMVCFDEKPDIQEFVYDAKFICNSIGKKYDVLCGKN